MNARCIVQGVYVLVLGAVLSGSAVRGSQERAPFSGDPQQMADVLRQNKTGVSEEQDYQTLRNALWRGEYAVLIDYGSSDRRMDAHVHRLVAQAAGTEFLRYAKGDLYERTTYEQRLEVYNRLSPLCTKHYEAAVHNCPEEDQYTRAQLADEWLGFKECGSFTADSQLLKRLFPTHPQYKSRVGGETLAGQAEHFRKAVEKAIEEGRQARLLAPNVREEIVRSLVAQFQVYSQMGIPATVMDETIRDLPFLFDEGLPMRFLKKMSRVSEICDTFQWYLWMALITELPDTQERKQIETQLADINKIITSRTADFNIPAECRAYFDESITQWQSMYPRLRENRFAPYFKRALPAYRFKAVCTQVENSLGERRRNLEAEIAMLAWLPRDNKKQEDRMQGICRRQGFATLVDIFSSYIVYDRPVFKPVPDKIFYRDMGTLNEYSVYTFIPGSWTAP